MHKVICCGDCGNVLAEFEIMVHENAHLSPSTITATCDICATPTKREWDSINNKEKKKMEPSRCINCGTSLSDSGPCAICSQIQNVSVQYTGGFTPFGQ